MNHRSPLLRLLAVLCFAALVSAQVWGVTRGYLCGCPGYVEWTALDHCHAPHDGDCHRQTSIHAEEDHGPADSSDRHNHTAAREDLQSLTSLAAQAPALVTIVFAVLDEGNWQASKVGRESFVARAGVDTGPPTGVTVAGTVVLLI